MNINRLIKGYIIFDIRETKIRIKDIKEEIEYYENNYNGLIKKKLIKNRQNLRYRLKKKLAELKKNYKEIKEAK